MTFVPRRRATLLIPEKENVHGSTPHLFVLLNDPLEIWPGKGREVLLVNLSSVRTSKNADKSCILRPGDHPFIRHEIYNLAKRG